MGMRAVVLLSGGLDSATTLAIARAEGREIAALTFRYGQRHAVEIASAQAIAKSMDVSDHTIIDFDLRVLGGSALTSDIPVPKTAAPETPQPDSGLGVEASSIPITYVPARNTIFLAYALALAEVRGADEIFLGVNAIDYSGYPDCRPEFVAAFESVARLATRAGVEGRPLRIRAPLIDWRKEQIIARGLELGVDYARTHSCYDPDERGRACARCESCRLRLAAFERLGIRDPAPYSDSAGS